MTNHCSTNRLSGQGPSFDGERCAIGLKNTVDNSAIPFARRKEAGVENSYPSVKLPPVLLEDKPKHNEVK